jgi:hypothetical protein
MKRSSKYPGNESEAVHPFETVLELVAEESVDPVDEARANSWAHALRQRVDTQLAALRRQLTPARPVPRHAVHVSDEIRSLNREALLARLEVVSQAPEVRIAHLDLSGLSEDDLRQLVAEIEATERTLA